jgi:organic hydroperoxide reductase OsmC/OhrA
MARILYTANAHVTGGRDGHGRTADGGRRTASSRWTFRPQEPRASTASLPGVLPRIREYRDG